MNELFQRLFRQASSLTKIKPPFSPHALGKPSFSPYNNTRTFYLLDNPLTVLRARGRYLRRQGQNIFNAVQNFGPTALNPLATRTPTTRLGKVGSLLNPLNPVNIGGYAADALIGTVLPENLRGTARAALYTPGGPAAKIIGGSLYDLFLNPSNAGVGLNPGTLAANDPEAYRALQAFKNSQAQAVQRPLGSLAILNGNEVEWRGKDLGWQRTYSEGANAPPPASDLNSSLYGGPQAGQVMPPIPPAGPGVVSNGAGVPAQRQDVINRSLSQEVLNAAQQYAAPTNVPISAFYEGQQQLGRSMMQQGNLVSELQRLGAAPGMTPENLKAWAQQNPDLAYREFLRLKQK